MESVSLKAYGKVNLVLDVREKRPDGYHELASVMQSVSVYDTLTLTKTEDPVITVACDAAKIPLDERNLAYRAAALLLRAFRLPGGVSITIEKSIPVAGGMAGGSADAAGTLVGMNALFELGLSAEELRRFGETLGSDVPFLIEGGTALVRGRGEIIQPLPPVKALSFVLGNPGTGLSTPEVFRTLDESKTWAHPDAEQFSSVLFESGYPDRNAVQKLVGLIGNSMENAAVSMDQEIGNVRDALRSCGAKNVLLSGSGPTVFGAFTGKTAAKTALRKLRKEYDQYQWFSADCVERGTEITKIR